MRAPRPFIALWLLLGTLTAASAHAVLRESVPADGSQHDTPPREIVLRFSETVTPIFVRLVGQRGETISHAENLSAADNTLRLALPAIGDGRYVISYRVVSADSHPVSGAVTFAVGVPADAVPNVGQGADERGWQAAYAIIRFLFYGALLTAGGGVLYLTLVARFAPVAVARARPLIGAAAIAGLATAILALGVKGGQLALGGPAVLFNLTTWQSAAATSLGASTLLAGTGLLVVMAGLAMRNVWGRFLAASGVAAAVGSLALSGHSTGGDLFTGVRIVLIAHVLAAAFWAGSLWPLRHALAADPLPAAAAATRRFSALAVPLVAILVLSGTALALGFLGNIAAMAGSAYGVILSMKVVAVAALIVLALWNRFRLLPRLNSNNSGAAVGLRRTIFAELAIVGVVLALTAVLAQTPPPRKAGNDDHDHMHHATPAGAVVQERREGDRTITLRVTPAAAGRNRIVLTVAGPDGTAIAVPEVALEFTHRVAGIAPIRRTMHPSAPGIFELDGSELMVSGTWQVTAFVLIDDFHKVVVNFEIFIS
jgi:copper transport protein